MAASGYIARLHEFVGHDLLYRQEIVEARYFGPKDALPPMRPCCVAKTRDAFAFCGQPFFR